MKVSDNMKVSVSILKEINNYKNAIKKVDNSVCDYLHLDIMDSTFTTDSSFTVDDFKDIKSLTDKKIDVHLMSTNLDKLIDDFESINPSFITIHVEVPNIIRYINKIKNKKIKVGLAINPDTDIEKLYPYLELIDLVLVMSVNPGKGGQSFMTSTICKMQELKEIQPNYNFLIEVDGGINDKTINYVRDYADIVVSGSYITDSDNYDENIYSIK